MAAQPISYPIRRRGTRADGVPRRARFTEDPPRGARAARIDPPHVRGPNGLIVVEDRVDPRLTALFRHGRPILLASRVSTDSGGQPVIQMVNGLWEAAASLADYGIDTRPALDTLGKVDLITRFIAEAETLRNLDADTGKPFTNRVLVVEDLAVHGLVLWLSCGSGRKTDPKFTQPALQHLVEHCIQPCRPALVYAGEISRMARTILATAYLVHALEHLIATSGEPVFGGDRLLSVSLVDDQFEDRALKSAQASVRELAVLRGRHGGGQRQRTGHEMVDGRVAYAGNAPAPPGMATARLRPFGPGTPRRILHIDSPQFRPDPAIIRATDDPIYNRDGSPAVDQAALVCWAFDHLYTPGHGPASVADYLRSHGYATQALRRRYHTAWPAQPAPTSERQARANDRTLLRPLLDHLEHYRTGTFGFALPGSTDLHRITGIFPARGYWLDDASYARISQALAAPAHLARGNRPFLFSGLPVTANGRAATLEAHTRGHDEPYYYSNFKDGNQRSRGHVSRGQPAQPLPHHTLIEGIVAALSSDESPLPRLPETERPRSQAADAVQALTTTIADLTARRRRIENFVEAGTPDVEGSTPNTTRPHTAHAAEDDRRFPASMWPRHAELSHQIAEAEAKLAEAELRLARASGPQLLGLQDAELLDLVRELGDWRSPRARQMLRTALTNVAVHTTRTEHADRLVWWDTTVTATLRIHNDTATYELPMSAEVHGGPGARMTARITHAVEQLYHGTPLSESLGTDWRRWIPVVRASLGVADGDQLLITHIDDARLLQLVMAVRYPRLARPARTDAPGVPLLAGPPTPSRALPALAEDLDTPLALLQRIATLYTPRDRGHFCWLNPNSAIVAQAFQAARRSGVYTDGAANPPAVVNGPFGAEWDLADGRAHLRACGTCGRTNRIPLRLREAEGSVCRHCRTDRINMVWPRSYDRYAHAS